MIGAGTGISPFMAYLEEKEFLTSQNPNIPLPTTTLFFGCKELESDFIFKQQLKVYEEKGLLNKLNLAVSREEVLFEFKL
jgi:sulfite reductase alpha subunit-like flavoprotein